jgi:hypothetical protein
MRKRTCFAFVLLLTFFISCTKNELAGFNILTETKEVGAPVCPSGGVMINTGLDKNRNNLLESAEVESTKYICSGDDKLPSDCRCPKLN